MLEYKLATMINDAVQECITFGSGCIRHGDMDIEAQWAEDGDQIELMIFKNGDLVFTYTEEVKR